MKQIVWLLLLTLALPVAGFANSVDLTNSGGTLSGSNSGLSLSGSTLIAINGPPLGLITGDFGSVTFSTGALSSGSLQSGGTFAAGGSFMITGNGTDNIPNGVIFNGTFSGPVTWTLITLSNGTHNYTLTGALTGTWFSGQVVDGATVQLTVNTGKGFFNGSTIISSGGTNITGNGLRTVVPEPESISLLGTGLIGLAGILRRKVKQ
jgi:PEP-CTERM motif